MEDIDADAYNGDGMVFQISSGFSKNVPLNNVRVSHVTVATRGRVKSLILVGAAPDNPRLPFAISFNDNIVPAGTNSVWSSGRGTCPKSGQPATTFKNCWSSFEVKNNVIIDYAGGQGAWPQGNFLVKDIDAVGFERINNDEPDYRLSSTSHFAGKASDSRNAGADMDAVRAAIEGVR